MKANEFLLTPGPLPWRLDCMKRNPKSGAGTPPSTAKAHSYAPDERRPAWDLAHGRPFRPWRKKGDETANRRALRRPIGESANYLETQNARR